MSEIDHDRDTILSELAAAEARVAKVEATVDDWQRELDSGAIRDEDARYCWALAAREIRAALRGDA